MEGSIVLKRQTKLKRHFIKSHHMFLKLELGQTWGAQPTKLRALFLKD